MLEAIASAVLSKVLGDYVKGFEAKNIKFSWSGELTLKNLELSPMAIDSFDLPIKLKSGTLGMLHMTIPWRELGIKPSIIRIERLFVIAGPRSPTEYDEETTRRREQLAKERKLQYVTLLKQARAQAKERVTATTQNSEGFVKRIVTTIVNNLQIYIDKIHIRYEDDLTNTSRKFAFGVTLEHLHAQSTDENCKPAIGSSTGALIYKLISLKNLALYWNPDTFFLKYSSLEEMNDLMNALIWSDNNETENVYVLEPISGELKLVLHKSDVPDMSTPLARAKSVFEKIQIALKENQYVDFISLIRRFVNYKKGSKYRKWRPKVSVKENPRAWWAFVGAAMLSQVRERRETWRWEYMKQRRLDKMTYIKLYKKIKKRKPLSETEQNQLKALETKLSFEDILFFRTLTEIYLKREQKELEERPARSGLLGWFASWFSSENSDNSIVVPYFNIKLGEAEWKEINDVFQWNQENNDNTNTFKPPPEWVKIQADFLLGDGSVALQLANGDPISILTFNSLQLALLLRDKWITFTAQLDSLEVTDHFTRHSNFVQIVSCQHVEEILTNQFVDQRNTNVPRLSQEQSKELFKFRLDIDPADRVGVGIAVQLSAKPVNVVYNYPLIHRIVSYVVDPILQSGSSKKFLNINLKATSQLKWILRYKKSLYLDLDFHAPNIFLPENVCVENCPMLFVVLGHFRMMTLLSEQKVEELERALAQFGVGSDQKNFYDSFFLNVSRLQVLLATANDKDTLLSDVKQTRLSKYHLLEPSDAELILRICKVNVETLPNVKIEGQLPSLRLRTTSSRLKTLLTFIVSVVNQLNNEKLKAMAFIKQQGQLVMNQQMFTEALLKITQQKKSPIELKGTIVEGNFKILEAFVSLQQDNITSSEIAIVNLKRIGVAFEKSAYDFRLKARLHDLIIEDMLQPFGHEYRRLATFLRKELTPITAKNSTEDESDFITIDYSNISPNAPHFENIDQYLILDFKELSLVVNRETVTKLLVFFSQIAPETKTFAVETIEMDFEEPVIVYQPKRRIDPDHTIIKITAAVSAIKLSLNVEEENSATPFVSATLSDSEMKLMVKDNSLLIEGRLGTLSTQDLRQISSKYKHIIGIKGENVLNFTFSINECKDIKNVKDEYKLDLTFSSLRFIYMESFVSELLTYLNVFGDIFEKTRQTVANYISEFYQTPTKVFRYKVKLEEPLTMFPLNMTSSDVIVANLGEITIQNNFCRVKDESPLIEEIAIKVKNCNLFTGCLPNAEVSPNDEVMNQGNPIFKWKKAHLNIERLTDLSNTSHKQPDMNIRIFIHSVELCSSIVEIKKLLKMWHDNLLVQPSPTTIKETRRRNELAEMKKRQRMQSHSSIKKSENEVNVWTTLMLSLEIDVISLQIMEPSTTYGIVTAPSNSITSSSASSTSLPIPIASLELKNFEMLMNTTSNDFLNIELGIWSLEIRDKRPSSNVAKDFRTFVMPIKRNEESYRGHVTLKYTRTPNGKQEMLMMLNCLRIVPIPEITLKILNILNTAQTQLNKVLERRTKLQLLLNPTGFQKETPPSQTSGGTVMRIVITKPQLCVVEDLTNSETKAFVIHSNITFEMSSNYKGQRISLMLQGTEIFKTTLSQSLIHRHRRKSLTQHQHSEDSVSLSVAIIEPFDTTLDLKIDVDCFNVVLNIQPVRMVFSYADFKIFMSALEKWNASVSSLQQTVVPDEEDIIQSSSLKSNSETLEEEREDSEITESEESSFDSDEFVERFSFESEDEGVWSDGEDEKGSVKNKSGKEQKPKKKEEKKSKNKKKEEEESSSSKSKRSKESSKKEEKTKGVSTTKKVTSEHKENKNERGLSFGKKTTPIKEKQDKVSPTKSTDNIRQTSKGKDTLKTSEQVSSSRSPSKTTATLQTRNFIDGMPTTLSKIQLPETKPKQQTAILTNHQIEIMFIDDSQGIDVPLFRLFIDKWGASFANWSQQLQLLAKIEMHVVYFNVDRNMWEPFIEPWEVKISANGPKITLTSDRKLDLNFTKSLLKTLQNAIQTWLADINQPQGVKAVETHPPNESPIAALSSSQLRKTSTLTASSLEFSKNEYYIYNLTGVKIRYWVDKMVQPRELAPQKQEPLILPSDYHQRTEVLIRRGIASVQKLVLSFQLEGYEEIHTVPIHHVERFSVEMSDGARVIISVSFEKGCKVVHISSPITVENLTDVDIALLVEFNSPTRKPIELSVVKPNQRESIPIHLIKDGQLHFRPHNRGYQWSSLSCALAKLECRTTKSLVCMPKDPTKSPFLFSINVDKDVDPTLRETRDYHIISMAIPLVIENLLPCKLEYQLYDRKTETILEKGELEKGNHASLYHFETTQELSLAVRLPGFSWSKQEVIASSKTKELAQRMTLFDSRERSLFLNIDNTESDGTRTILLWCSHWIINRTGLPLQFAEKKDELAAGQLDPPENWDAILKGEPRDWYFEDYLQCPPLLFSKKEPSSRLHIRLPNTVWSKGLGIQNASNVFGFVELLEKAKGDNSLQRLFEFSVIEYAARNKFWRTKVLTLAPRFIVVNKLNKTILIRQSNTNSAFSLLPNERAPFHWVNGNLSEKTLQIRIDTGNCPWSGAFKLTEMEFFPLQILDKNTQEPYFVRVRTKLDHGIVTVLFTEESDNQNPLFKIENHLDVDVSVWQKNISEYSVNLKPGESRLWGWFEPMAIREVELQINGYPHPIVHRINKITERYRLLRWTDVEGRKREAVIYVRASGSTRVLQLKPKEPQLKKDPERKKEIDPQFTALFSGVGISVINEKPEELLYITFEGLRAEYASFAMKQSIYLEIKDCQIDNQLTTTYHPVLLYSTAEKPPNFLQFTLIKNNSYPNLLYLEYLSFLVREMNILVDEEIVIKLLSFIDITLETLHDKNASEIEEFNPLQPKTTENEANARIVYQELVHFNPIRLNLTFTAVKSDENHEKTSNNLARMLLAIPDKLLPNVENAPIVLNALMIRHTFTTQDDLTTSLIEHYKSSVLRQIYKILGSFDFLGNPISLIKNLGTGVRDFFYEPAKGITVSPREFGSGLARGTKSLVKKSIYAVFNVATKITGSLSKGVAMLSLDKEYQQKRQVEKHRQKPRNVLEGVGYGLKDFGTGLFTGVTGLITQPVKGGMEEGAKGVLKGFGRGIAGVIIKPSVGAIDLITRTTEGVRNTTLLGDKKVERKRPPRYFGTGDRLKIYSQYEAEGQDLLHSLGSTGEYWDHIYWYHEEFDRKRVLLISDKMVFFLKRKKIEWKTPWNNVQEVQSGPEPNQIRFVLSRKASLIDSTNEKIMTCQSVEQATKVLRVVQDLLERWRTLTSQTNLSRNDSTIKTFTSNITNVNSET